MPHYKFKLFGEINCLNTIGGGFVKILLYFFTISNCFALHAQNNENTFKKIIIEIDGEEVYDVSKITQDSHGYLWMATNLGLIRYDGLEAKKYDIKIKQPNYLTIRENSCWMEDRTRTSFTFNYGINPALQMYI